LKSYIRFIQLKWIRNRGENTNKRLKKKRKKIIDERYRFINSHIILSGRKNGKTYTFKQITKALFSNQYAPFKKIKKLYNKIFIGMDMGNEKDYSVKTTCRISSGKITVLKTEILN